MKLAPFLIGAISAQSGDDADRWDNTDFSLTDNIFTYEAPKDERFDGTTCGTQLVIQAVTCWESNHMGNLDHYVTTNDDGFGWKNIHHGHDQGGHSGQAGTGYGQGTQESTNYGQRVPSTSPNYQIGTYSRGMMTDGVNGAINRIDYHSAMAFDNRYSGCIYEAAGWDYTATTYNAIWRMSYGYDPTRSGTSEPSKYLNDASGVDRSNTVAIRPNWWHYFNSHILNVGQFDNQFDSYERHLLVMANPAYEGLGYLNWITTFAKFANNDESDGSQEDDRGKWGGTHVGTGFVGSTIGNAGVATDAYAGAPNQLAPNSPYDEGRFRGMINHNTHDTVTDLFSGGYAFHLGMNCAPTVNSSAITFGTGNTLNNYNGLIGMGNGYDHEMNPEVNIPTRGDETTALYGLHTSGWNYDTYSTTGASSTKEELKTWYSFLINPSVSSNIADPSLKSTADAGITFYPWMSMAAVSSFPHNDLGQDFRFNIRILHHGGRGFPYYFMGNQNQGIITDASNGYKVEDGDVGTGTNFSITSAQINYLAQDSYYWYKVNTVQIMFPSYVRCPRFPRNITTDKPASSKPDQTTSSSEGFGFTLQQEEELHDTFRCMDSANFNGHRGWDSSKPYNHGNPDDIYSKSAWDGINTSSAGNHRPNVNHPIYLEQLTENDGTAYKGIVVDHDKNEDATFTGGATTDPTYDSEAGFICGPVPPFGSLTSTDYKGGWYKCGQKYAVHGLMNSYDEHAQLEYGTTQEIWFQFWYHYVITFDTDLGNDATAVAFANEGFWDKRNSNTNRYKSPKSSAANPPPANPDHDWPSSTNKVFHDGAHDNVYFTASNYKNAYAGNSDTIRYDHVHNFPNILFNAFELRGIRFYCDKSNSLNSNECFHTGITPDGGAPGYTAATLIGDSMTNP